VKTIYFVAIGLVAFSQCYPALAACDRVPSGLSSFGAAELDDTRAKLPRDVTRSANCVVDDAKDYADCEFTDRNGVAYTVFGNQITRKTITVRPGANTSSLPFGLAASDTIGQVVRKIASRRDTPELFSPIVKERP
jgi:hypothetical protein